MLSENAKQYCRDDISRIENYDKAVADTTQTWDCHHRWELTLDGEFAHSAEELIAMDMYYNRPYFELIFIPHDEHQRLHHSGDKNPMYGRTGEKHPMFGKHQSEETKQMISASAKIAQNRPDVKAKKSDSGKIAQNRPGVQDRIHTPEANAKISASCKIVQQALSRLYYESKANGYTGTWNQFKHDHSIGLV